jgi:tetratricopeptide (TPR) repeat protein
MELFSHIIANDPYYPEAYNLVGQILLKRGRLDESMTMFKRALDVDALNKGAVKGLLVATMDMGIYDKTQQWFDYAHKHDELFGPVASNMLKFRFHMTQGLKHKAFDYLNQVSLEEEGHGARYNDYIEGEKAYFQKDYNGAMLALERMRHQRQNTEDAFYRLAGGQAAAHLAQVYKQLEMTDKLNELLSGLEQYLDKDKEKQINNSSYYYNMAMIRSMQNKPTEAFYYLQGAIDVGWVQSWKAEIEPIFAPINEDIQFTLMMGGVKARLATMRARVEEEEAFMLEETESI